MTNRLAIVISIALFLLCIVLLYLYYSHSRPSIKIGILHSLSGTMAVSESPLVDALQLAIEEANATDGINGQLIEALVVDCRSDAGYCAEQAERLITEEKVSVLFGCWTSSCRKAVKPVVEKHQHLLFYPVQYEGMEQSANIIYTGAAPNQQIIPGARWALEKLGKRVYLAGSDYVFPRMANIIIKDVLKAGGGVLAGERYLPLGADSMDALVADIGRQRPDVILNTLNGDSNVAFFNALEKAGSGAAEIPVLSFSMAEVELAGMGKPVAAGHYAVWNYFQSIVSPQNQVFVGNFRKRYGMHRVLDDPMEASYTGMKLWLQAAREAGSAAPVDVQRTILRQTLNAPVGMVAIDADSRHLWKTPRIGKIGQDGQFDIVWDAGSAMEPAPFPGYRFRDEWLRLLAQAERSLP
ncbi:MAG TPA: ABC transporter substrate-binding protein [Gallionellaceae bacterium]|nr:ABC transporter substrate-binding protein [Gallionellaceae bacterium]